MIKTKYDRMNKNDKKELIKKYKASDNGKAMIDRLYRLRLTGFISLIVSIGLYVIQYNELDVIDYLMLVPLFLASILFIMMSFKIQRKVLNKFAVKNK